MLVLHSVILDPIKLETAGLLRPFLSAISCHQVWIALNFLAASMLIDKILIKDFHMKEN